MNLIFFRYKFGVICNVFHATNYNCFKRAIYCVNYTAQFGTDCLHRLTRDNLVQKGTKNAINLSKEFSSGFFRHFQISIHQSTLSSSSGIDFGYFFKK